MIWFMNVTARQRKITSAQSAYPFSRNIVSAVRAAAQKMTQIIRNLFLFAITADLSETSTGVRMMIVTQRASDMRNSARAFTNMKDERSITATNIA